MESISPYTHFNSRWSRLSNVFKISFLTLVILSISACSGQKPTTIVKIGEVNDFLPGSVTHIELQAAFNDPDPPASGSETPGVVTQEQSMLISPVPIFLVNDPSEGLIALYDRDPHLGCNVTWVETNQRFENPCHGEKYSQTGAWLTGPSLRGLDRFAVTVTQTGEIWVDVNKFEFGPPR